MGKIELFFTGLTLVVGALGYFAGVIRTNKQRDEDDAEMRISKVVDKYVVAAQAAKSNGLHGLTCAGVGILKSDKEIREAIARISKHGQHSNEWKKLDGIDAYQFFTLGITRKKKFLPGGDMEALIKELREKGA